VAGDRGGTGERWTVLLYTDGLVEGRVGAGSQRLGADGLIHGIEALVPGEQGSGPARQVERLLGRMIERVRELNGGDLDDDLAVLAFGYDGQKS
jgi:serine phosphatase RsbU (regulator of sigma subunit)